MKQHMKLCQNGMLSEEIDNLQIDKNIILKIIPCTFEHTYREIAGEIRQGITYVSEYIILYEERDVNER